MTDDTSKTGAPDRIRINTRQAHERSYWTKRLFINSQQELRRIVRITGPMVSDVKAFLIDRITNA